MRQIIYLMLILLTLISCNQNKDISNTEITKISVHYIPFEILTPTQLDESSIRSVKNYVIEDSEEIDKIKNQIVNLSRLKSDEFNKNSIYLLCDFYGENDEIITLMFDKTSFDIDGKSYNKNELLLNMLIKEK